MPLVAAAAVAAGAAVQSATGFGFSLVAAPLVFAAIGPEEAIGLLLVLGTQVNVMTLATEKRRPRPVARDCAVILAFALPGAVLGVAALRGLDQVVLQIAVSVGVVATLAARRFGAGHRMPRWVAPIAGFFAGGLSTSTSTTGPPLLVYLLGRHLEPIQVRDSLTVCFLGLTVVTATALAVTGTSKAVPDAVTVAILIPVVALGHVAGRPLFAALARSRRYEPVVTALLVISVTAGLASAML
jgi:uncharacterized membrane protein YfcA